MTKTLATLLLTCLLLVCGYATAHAAAPVVTRVAIKSAVELDASKNEITLSDLVVAKGLSRTAIERFRAIRLSDAPKPGETRTFTSSTLSEALQKEIESIQSETGEVFGLKIPSRISVSKKRARLEREQIEKELLSQFKAQCSDCEFQITNLSVPAINGNLPADAQWNIRSRADLPKGSFSIPIEISSGSRPAQTFWISGVVSIRRPVPVAAREIAIGDRLQPEDLITTVKDVTYATDTPVTLTEIAAGVAARQIAAGQIVYRSSIRKELAVKSGETVKVSAGSAEWQITLDGVSQTSGYVGDTISVKIPSTKKLVSGLLKEKGVVEIQ